MGKIFGIDGVFERLFNENGVFVDVVNGHALFGFEKRHQVFDVPVFDVCDFYLLQFKHRQPFVYVFEPCFVGFDGVGR